MAISSKFFGIQDDFVPGPAAYGVRIHYPSDDGVIVGAPLPPGPRTLIVFAHGQRTAGTEGLCPLDVTQDYRRWSLVLGALARSGFVVAAPDLHDVISSPEASAERVVATVQWLRTQWSGRRILHRPQALNPGGLTTTAEISAHADVRGASHAANSIARILPPIYLGPPTDFAVVGHSYGARAVALVAALGEAKAFASIAGSFDDNASIAALISARIPTCLLCGTADLQRFSYLNGLWPSLSTPKYQAALQSVEHWGWFGPSGAIRHCDDTPFRGPEAAHIAGELIAGFMTRHLARIAFDPSHLVNIPLLRPSLEPWFRGDPAVKVRWDTPEVPFDELPSTGDGILGGWTDSPPW